jgi:hypothetical protein
MLVGLITYLVVIYITYLIARVAFDDHTIAIFVALAISLLGPIHRYGTYFYPQAFAVVLVLILLFISLRAAVIGSTASRLYTLLAVPIIVALWFTHHLTVILFAPILLGLVVASSVVNWTTTGERTLQPQLLPIAAWVGGSVSYWLIEGIFIEPVVRSIREVLFSATVVDQSGSGRPLVALGQVLPEPSIIEAVASLLSPGGVYNIMLVCVLALGVLLLLDRFDQYRRPAGFLLVGVLGAGLLIRTPIAATGVKRLQLPLSLFVAFIIGIAIKRMLMAEHASMTKLLPAFFVFILLASSAPIVVADDLYGLHSGPDLWESRNLPETQKEFSDAEVTGFEQSTQFVADNELAVGTDWHSEIGFSRYGMDTGGMQIQENHIETESDVLLVRQRWPEHSLRLIPERLSLTKAIISEEWMRTMMRSEHKIYTTGDVSIIADWDGGDQFQTG